MIRCPVGAWGGVYLPDNTGAVLNLKGGAITNNTCLNNGGGVHVSGTATMNISGSPVVSGNTKNGAANNINLASKAIMRVTDALTNGADLGVSMSGGAGTFTRGYGASNGTTYSGAYFRADNADNVIALADGEAALAKPFTVTVGDNAVGKLAMDKESVAQGDTVTVTGTADTIKMLAGTYPTAGGGVRALSMKKDGGNTATFIMPGGNVKLSLNQYVNFDEYGWDQTAQRLTKTERKTCDYMVVTEAIAKGYPEGLPSGNYVVQSSTTINEYLYVQKGNTVNLIVKKGATLLCKQGIGCGYDKNGAYGTLNIFGEGTLVANGKASAAGIGGNSGESNGNITIHIAAVTATGGNNAAGIGCGEKGRNTDATSIKIYRGTVRATSGSSGAGIGGGNYDTGTPINIYIGTITAEARGGAGAGIGGGDGSGTRGIYIAGGTVTAIGGEYAAGIGGGSGGGNIRTIHISGGNVTASSNSEAKSFCGGPGIGGGGIANMKGTIKITGAGTHVKATGGKGGAGIGAGGYLDLEGGGDMGGKIIIDCGEGSRIEATGGKYSAGIGAGIAGNMTGSVTIDGGNVYIKAGDDGGAGIGGGTEVWPNIGGEGGDVYINGGYVEISGVDSGAESIGHGDDDMKSGTVKLADGMRVTVGGDPIKRSDRTDECHSRNKGEKLVVEACPHEITYEIMESGHTSKCAWCYQKYSEEPHIFDDGSKCTVCEYQDGMITIHFEPGDEGASGEMANVMVMPDSLYELPECGFTAPEGKRFGGWQLSDALYAEGDEITLNEHTTFTAVWLNLCTVHFEPSISEYEGEMTDVQVVEGDTYFLPECGYSSTWELLFREWVVIYDNQHSEHKNPGDPITVTNDIRVRGQWSLGVNLTFRPGYEGAPDEEKGYKVIIDKEITLPECEFTPPEGMAFAGWLIGEETLQPGDVISVPKSMIVIAQWQEITEEPAEEPTEETTEETTEEPAEETTEEPSEEPAEEPTEEPTEEPAEEPAEVPSEAPAEESAEEPAGEPAEQHVEAPAEEHAEEPAAERAEEAAEEPAKETAEEPAEEPAQEPAEESSEEPVEEPAEQTADAQMCTLTFSNGGADGEMEPVKVAQGSEYELPECEFSLDGLVFDSWEIEGADGTTNAQPGDVIVVETDETITATWLWNETDGIEYGEDEVENAEAGDEAEAADDAPAGLTIEAEETPAEGSDPDAPSEVGSVFNGAGIAAVIAAVVLVIITAGTVAAKKKKKK